VDGVLIDLGVSSLQLGDTNRGFAFALNGPLDMRFDPSRGTSAADFVAQATADTIERTLREFSDEPHAHRIASALVAARTSAPILTTGQLAALVARAVGSHRGRLHPATRTFQALRIAVNEELEALSEALPQALELLRRGARLAVISFHSLEDRIVKTTLARWAGRSTSGLGRHAPAPEPPSPPPRIRILTPRPIVASVAERAANPRSRSARLRAAERL
jgi:16S rRNA (cytosine1402-N4)-methyltransferase